MKFSDMNNLNPSKEIHSKDLLFDDLWIIDKRTPGYGNGSFHGNFVPEIPKQLMLRYTKRGETVMDPMAGSGTTLDMGKFLGRNVLAYDLNPARPDIHFGDVRTLEISARVQLIILHPPYSDIIKFSEKKEDLSKPTKQFLQMFKTGLSNVLQYLDTGRILALVIGNKYEKGKFIPLGWYCFDICQSLELNCKTIICKNFEGNVKDNTRPLWRYRALVGGFYLFKHEYIEIFVKK